VTRPRLLFLAQTLAYPPHSGVANRTFNVMMQLQRAFDVHLLAFSRRNHQPDAPSRLTAQAALAERLSRVATAVPVPAEASRPARVWCHLRSVVTARPYTYYEYASPEFGRALARMVEEVRPDLIHLDSLDLYRWLDALPGVPVAVTHHSVESDLLRLRARRIRPRALAPYLAFQAVLLERIERQLCPGVCLNVMMSETDAARLERLAPGSPTVTVPNGVDVAYFRPDGLLPVVPGRVVFLGPTYMYPNRDAVDFFLEEIWRAVRAAVPGAELHLVGKNPPADRARYLAHDGVICHGYVPDIRPLLGQAACSVVPLRIGGGTRLKILDSWAMGAAIVSTTVGCEGLEAHDGRNMLIRDRPGEFAEAVVAVLRHDALRCRLSAAGRETVERSYGWDPIGDRLIRAYRGLLGA
jgi:glycosyltransferase involved in cell wall biosynthesis